ncbi:hypothetical protein HAP94_00860 [Acidithiobacillus ferrivorans]|nr:hypothetical protein [Acidithiobacillus ferrivorans]
MKMTILKLAVFAACAVPAASLPVAANAALVYTPPQAMVLTCNGAAPSITNKTAALATFACANGQIPQAVGVTSGMSSLLGLASGASVLAASEAVPHMALPGLGGGSGNGSGAGPNNSGNGSGSNGPGAPGSGNRGTGATGSNASNGAAGSSTGGGGSGSNASNSNGSSGSKGNGSNASNGATGSSTGGGLGSNASNSTGSGNAAGKGSGSGTGTGNGGQASGGGIGSFFGHLAHAVGAVAQQVGTAVLMGGQAVTVGQPLAMTGLPSAVPTQPTAENLIPSTAPTQTLSQAAGFSRVDAWLLQQMRANKAAGAVTNGLIHIIVTSVSVTPSSTYTGLNGNVRHGYWGIFSARLYYKPAPIVSVTGRQPGWLSAPVAVTYTVASTVPPPEGALQSLPRYPYEGDSSLGTGMQWGAALSIYGTSPINYEPSGPACRTGPRLPCDHQPFPAGTSTNKQFLGYAAIDTFAAGLGLQNYSPEMDWEN